MIQLSDNLWIGNSSTRLYEIRAAKIGGVLNVALDLRSNIGWPEVEYMQVGIIDGPGNPPSAYCAAVLALTALRSRHRVVVYCHTGGRSLAVVMMYINMTTPYAPIRWDDMMSILSERTDARLPPVHEAHRSAFEEINWRQLVGI